MSVSVRTDDTEVARSERYAHHVVSRVYAGHGVAKGTDKGTGRSDRQRYGQRYASIPARTFLVFPQVTASDKGTGRSDGRYAPRFMERYVFPPLFREAGAYLPEPSRSEIRVGPRRGLARMTLSGSCWPGIVHDGNKFTATSGVVFPSPMSCYAGHMSHVAVGIEV